MNKKKAILIFSGIVVLLFGVLVPLLMMKAGGSAGGYKKLPSGIQYKIVVDNKQPKAQVGNVIKANLSYYTIKDSLFFSSYKMAGQPYEIMVANPSGNGDVMDLFVLLGAGDSAIFLLPVDSAFKGTRVPEFIKGDKYIKLAVKIKGVAENSSDGEKIEDYLKKNYLTAQKTADGLYYIMEKQGNGRKLAVGDKVKVDYTGSLLDGTIFDSSVNSGRGPIEFELGKGMVIKGWDEGILLFRVGDKGKLIIPPSLGYGPNRNGPIPANSVLIFDIEVVGAK